MFRLTTLGFFFITFFTYGLVPCAASIHHFPVNVFFSANQTGNFVPNLLASKVDALVVDANGDGVPSPGDTLGYTITIENTGDTSATGVSLADPIPAYTSIVPGSLATTQGVVISEDPVQVDLGELTASATCVVVFEALIESPIPVGIIEIANQGTVSSTELPDVVTDDPAVGGTRDPTITSIVVEIIIGATKVDSFEDLDGNGVPSPDDILRYTIAIENTGNTGATGVGLVDHIPDHTSIEAGSLTTSQGAVLSEDPIQIDIGQLDVGTPCSVAFGVVIDNPLPMGVVEIANQGTVSSVEVPDVLTDDPDAGGSEDPTITQGVVPVELMHLSVE